jgi:site-specific DNA-cytosine methylase
LEHTFVERGYKEFADKNGYIPEMFNPYNRAEIKNVAPTVTTQCGANTSSSSVLKMDAEVSRTVRVGGHGDLGRHSWDVIEVENPVMLTPNNWGHKAGDGMGTRERRESAICPALQTAPGQTQQSYLKYNDSDGTGDIRIRKLTPRECLRLMGWRDGQIDKIAAAGISNAQQYRQAGNGIVVQVLEAVFRNLFSE